MYCVDRGRMAAVLTTSGRVALVGSTAPGHTARRIRTGSKAKRARKGTRAFGRGVRKRGRFVYVLRGGRVRAVAVTSATTRKAVRRHLRRAGLL